MCDFCHKHGEGPKWYLEANNYAEDLLSDLKRRDIISTSSPGRKNSKRAWPRSTVLTGRPVSCAGR